MSDSELMGLIKFSLSLNPMRGRLNSIPLLRQKCKHPNPKDPLFLFLSLSLGYSPPILSK